ncbi:hypothetical protein ACQ27_gp577 [Klebsiella phage K64-1]|nr:hypothetical protein ACQ27_gp577 [Klebsiella phage K64-1]QOE32307.1 hypothetical protein CPT_Muenster_135 [Klebsiella phage Muenster]QOE32657.1 hypothetical protein CPT_Muenster_491 [Klebsiella phage Muenster]
MFKLVTVACDCDKGKPGNPPLPNKLNLLEFAIQGISTATSFKA